MRIERIECHTWSEFKARVIEDLYVNNRFQKGIYLFRGQGSSEWTLSSNFDRWYKGNRTDKVKVCEKLLEQFTKECEKEDIPEGVRKDKDMMLSLAQHNGLPTRLLDWSESPYVAAFFAFSEHIRRGINLEKYVAIWVLEEKNSIWESEYGCQIINVPSFGNERIRNQYGKFTYLRAPQNSLEEYVEAFGDGDDTVLWKYLIPVRSALEVISDLEAMGINHARMYPGMPGNAKAAEVRVLMDMMS